MVDTPLVNIDQLVYSYSPSSFMKLFCLDKMIYIHQSCMLQWVYDIYIYTSVLHATMSIWYIYISPACYNEYNDYTDHVECVWPSWNTCLPLVFLELEDADCQDFQHTSLQPITAEQHGTHTLVCGQVKYRELFFLEEPLHVIIGISFL